MRPIKLSMTAFGPFIDTETVDFEVFGERPLFLINGATGAGKTTILDAICFALYGQTTGKEREAVQMRCDYADDTTTSVEFTFELGEHRYRILRVPEQTRAKKSGEGTTKQKARAELWQIDKAGVESVLVPQKVTEATQKIEELTGLLVDQFRQVMVLPQGQFRRLLMADSKDREQIFGQLFETGIYKKIEDKLKQLAANVELNVRTLKNEQLGVLQTVGFDEIDALRQAITEVEPERSAALTLKKSIEAGYLAALKATEVGKALDQEFAQLKSLNAERDELGKQSSDIELKETRLNLVDQALKIKPDFAEKLRLESELKTVSQETEIAEKKLQQAVEALKQATQNIENSRLLEREKDKQKQRAELLKGYRQRASKLNLAEDDLKRIESVHQKSALSLDAETKRLAQVQTQIKQSEVEKKRLEQLLTKETEVAASTQQLKQTVDVRQRYERLLVDKTKLEKQFAAITEKGKQVAATKEQKDTESKQLDLAWHAGQAAILARQLEHDQPCLVCGSLQHPSPAQATLDLPTDSQRESAQQALEIAQAELLRAREAWSKLKAELDGLDPQLAHLMLQLGEFSDHSLSQLRQQYEEKSAQLKRLQESRQQLVSTDKLLDEFKASLDSVEQQVKQIQQQFNDSLMQQQTCKTELAAAQKELPNEYRQSGKLETDIGATETSLEKLAKQIEIAQQAHIEASKQHSTAEAGLQALTVRYDALKMSANKSAKQWSSTLEKSVFSTEDEFGQADLSSEEEERLKVEVNSYKTKLQNLAGATQEREKSLAGKTQPDLAVLQQTLDKALDEKNQADQALQQIDKHLNRLQDAQNSLAVLADKLNAYDKEYKVIGTLSDVANGKIGNKISLQRFVLGVLLDDVLLAASTRLTRMSKGRYNLIRKEDRAKGNKASGLEMEVEDTYTGKVRAVSTLSGGESFLASLSLALGLSDVVQAYAGGIRLETLFIDEGFGSLDSDTLDLAIKTLIDLRNTGRMVGIISHVSELKEQISMRLDVVAGRQGSRIELVY